MDGVIEWGDGVHLYGYALRKIDLRYWTAFFTNHHMTDERGGQMAFDGKAWYSHDYGTVSYPYCVTDDYGALVPVPHS